MCLLALDVVDMDGWVVVDMDSWDALSATMARATSSVMQLPEAALAVDDDSATVAWRAAHNRSDTARRNGWLTSRS